VAGGEVRRSVLSTKVQVDTAAVVEGCVLMDNVHVGRGAVVRRAIIDKNVCIPPGTSIGVDHDEDCARGFVSSESGVVCIGKDDRITDAKVGG
jgi:glucose-1-phosphate adenylyltransferase